MITQSELTVHRERAEAFEERVREAGHSVVRVDRSHLLSGARRAHPAHPLRERQAIFDVYLRNLPLGSGIFTPSDQLASHFPDCIREEFPGHMDSS